VGCEIISNGRSEPLKLEIDEDNQQYRLVDGVEGTASYCTGDVTEFGERAELERDNLPDAYAFIDADATCDGKVYLADGTSEHVEFEFGCEFPEDDDDEDSGDEEFAESDEEETIP
jgi:hypothetical protein